VIDDFHAVRVAIEFDFVPQVTWEREHYRLQLIIVARRECASWMEKMDWGWRIANGIVLYRAKKHLHQTGLLFVPCVLFLRSSLAEYR